MNLQTARKSGFIQRLGYYFLGFAIGLVMLGALLSMRAKRAAQNPFPFSSGSPSSSPAGAPSAPPAGPAPAPVPQTDPPTK